MQCFLMGYRGNATCHLYFLSIHTENTSDAWYIPHYPTQDRCITTIYFIHILIFSYEKI